MPANAKQVVADLSALVRARVALIWLVTREEARAERGVVDAAAMARYDVTLWDCASGARSVGKPSSSNLSLTDPSDTLRAISQSTSRAVWVMRDLHAWLRDPYVCRRLRNLARELPEAPRDMARTVVVLTPSAEVPPELQGHAVVVDWPLPDREEVGAVLDSVLAGLEPAVASKVDRERAIDAAVGLTAEEVGTCYAKSAVTTRTVDPAVVGAEKKRTITRERVLEWFDPHPAGLDAVGGLENLKAWLVARRAALSQRARDFGLPAPKGVLLTGIPGCLAEGTRIEYRRGNRPSAAGRSLSIEVFYAKFNRIKTSSTPWVLEDVPTYLQSWDGRTGKIVFNEVVAVVDSGVKQCLRITTDTAGVVELTADHPVLMSDVTFRSAGDIRPGDSLLVRGSMKATASGRKRTYAKRIVVEGLKYHPVAWDKFVTEPTSGKVYAYKRTTRARLVIEAQMNKIPYDEFVRILKEEPAIAETLAFLPAEYDVHHIDENATNDAPDNLMVVTHEAHAAHHGDEASEHFKREHTCTALVVSVVDVGQRRTFDITMRDETPNFAVNDGIVVHNCGKSLTAKAVAAAWGVPLLRLDLGALRSKWVGESEANIRKALAVAEAVAPCVLWLDEIEKALGGATQGAADGGVSADALGAILTWLQDRQGSVFVVATSNDISALPPELMRKGRFDEIFFVDTPARSERVAILTAALAERKRTVRVSTETGLGTGVSEPDLDLGAVADASAEFTGSEVAELVNTALFTAFADGERALRTGDLLAAAREVVPLTKTQAEKVRRSREWAAERARRASSPEVESARAASRVLDLDDGSNGSNPEGN